MRHRFLLSSLASFALTILTTSNLHAQTVGTFASGLISVRSVAYDGGGNLYAILRTPTHQIVRFALPSNVPVPVASAGLSDPIEGVFGDDGNLYVTDYTVNLVKKVTPGGTVTNFAAATSPAAITRDAAGNLYVGEYFSQKILKITPAGVVSTYVPTVGAAGARLSMLYMDTDGTLYAGMLSGVIYKVGSGGAPITTFCSGLGSSVGFTKMPDGNWLTAAYDNNKLYSITPAGTPNLFAGSVAGHVDGPLATAKFNWPSFVLTVSDVVYVTDWNSDYIRTISDFATPVESTSWGRVKVLYR